MESTRLDIDAAEPMIFGSALNTVAIQNLNCRSSCIRRGG